MKQQLDITESVFKLRIFREKPGVISEGHCWIGICGPHMYTSLSFFGLLKQIITQWGNDRHLVG